MTNPLRIAVIGCGAHAQSHFRMIADEPRLQLAAIAELDDERRQRAIAKHSPEAAFEDYSRMLDVVDDLDIVHVITMPGHLLPIVEECLNRELHVSVEKSPGMSSQETKRMAEIAAASSGKAMVSFNRRYFPQVLALRQLLQAQGGAVHVAATYNKPLSLIGTPAMPTTPDPLICDAIHHVDLLRWLAGEAECAAVPVEVHAESAQGDRSGAYRRNAIVRFDTGAIGVLMSQYGVGYRIQRAEAHAEDLSAYLELTESPPEVEIYRARDNGDNTTSGEHEDALDLKSVGGGFFNEVCHFVDCILEDRPPWSPLDDAVHTMCLCEAICAGHKGALA
ncbi:MAG: Gfo/Idh/MocA family oxidoreductase [Candidatus Latescibacterota bacterium]|nr:Gfo/Idh/MocA family oxidoreductase [Candidatus Latescibacterota bacterium]